VIAFRYVHFIALYAYILTFSKGLDQFSTFQAILLDGIITIRVPVYAVQAQIVIVCSAGAGRPSI
jgi:hypothetical protein